MLTHKKSWMDKRTTWIVELMFSCYKKRERKNNNFLNHKKTKPHNMYLCLLSNGRQTYGPIKVYNGGSFGVGTHYQNVQLSLSILNSS